MNVSSNHKPFDHFRSVVAASRSNDKAPAACIDAIQETR